MNKRKIWELIEQEVKADKSARPNWPDHIVAQAGVVSGSAGDLINNAIGNKYSTVSLEQSKKAAAKTAATAIRFLENLKDA